MSGVGGVASVLEEHEAVGWMVDSRGEQTWTCGCGHGVDLPPEHHAHVAAAVLDHLRAEFDRLAAAEAIVARVSALADEWDERRRPGMVGIATAIRVALGADQ